MRSIQPLSEDFLYWSSEYIRSYLSEAGPEDAWFINPSDVVPGENQVGIMVEVNDEN